MKINIKNKMNFSENIILEDENLYLTDEDLMMVRHGSNPYLTISLVLCYFVLYLLGHEIIL